jgi:hypothetical protein
MFNFSIGFKLFRTQAFQKNLLYRPALASALAITKRKDRVLSGQQKRIAIFSVLSAVILIGGLIVFAAFGTASSQNRNAGKPKSQAATPNRLAVKILDFYADSLAHVADRHLAGGSLETAAFLAVRVLRVRLRLDSHDDAKLRLARDRAKQLLMRLPPDIRAGAQKLVVQKPEDRFRSQFHPGNK